jgi:hypothetical protein
VNDIVDRGLLSPMLVASDDSAAAVSERLWFLAELRRRGMSTPVPLSLVQPDGPQRVRLAAAAARSVVLTGASAPYGDMIRALPPTLAATVYLSYLTETADVTSLRERSGVVTWPGSRTLAPFSASAFDALSLIAAAARQAPAEIDGPRLRLRLEATTFAGIVTQYSFTPSRHAGFASEDLVYLRWNAVRGAPFVAPKPPGQDR